MAVQRSATHGVCTASPAWPPETALTLSVARREPGGTTGIRVTRASSAGLSSRRTASSTGAIWSMALTPRNGMLPWAVRPCVVTSNHHTPR